MLLMINSYVYVKVNKKSSICKVDDFFRAAPSSVAAIRLNHSASPVQEVSSMFVVWRMLHCPAAKPRVATGQGREVSLSTAQVQCGKNVGFDVFSVWLYLFIYIYCYCVILLYT